MPNYLHSASGLLDDAFPWSIRLYSTSAATEGAAETAWHAAMKALWQFAGFAALLPTTTTFSTTYTSTMDAGWKQTTKTTTDEQLLGTGGAALPFRSCSLVTWRTAKATRYGHGRWYLPGLTAAALATDGYFLSSASTALIAQAVSAAVVSWQGTLTPVILHRRGTKTGPGPLSTDNIIGADIPDEVATQRRRADKRVPNRTSVAF